MEARCQRSPRRAPKEFTETRSKRVVGSNKPEELGNKSARGARVNNKPKRPMKPDAQRKHRTTEINKEISEP
jgi:hypothetical protein